MKQLIDAGQSVVAVTVDEKPVALIGLSDRPRENARTTLARLKRRIPADAAALQRLRTLNQFFFRDLSFGGNVNDYCDPDNSYLNVVLRSRRGIQISLAVLWIELAQGIGLHARGVCFPGHFMVKVNLPKGQVVIDPFTGQPLVACTEQFGSWHNKKGRHRLQYFTLVPQR